MRSLSGIGRASSEPSKQTRNEGKAAAWTSTMPFDSIAWGTAPAASAKPEEPEEPDEPPPSPPSPGNDDASDALEHDAVPTTAPETSAVSAM